MICISGRIFIKLKIDGNDITFAPNLVSRITMTEGMGALSPAIELILNDYSGTLNSDLALTDGNEILVTVGKTPESINTQSRQYRLFGSKQRTSAMGPHMQVVGIYDAPGYLTGSVTESFEANTRDVLEKVAGKCKLRIAEGSVKSTEDKQIWLNVAKSRAAFMQEMVRHGRVGDKSAMMLMLNSLGELRYVDMTELIETPKEKIKKMFLHNVPEGSEDGQVYTVREARDYSVSGMMNTWNNYGSTRMAHSLSGTQKEFKSVEVSSASGFLPINEEVSKTVQKARIDYSPLDCGNNHDNYYKALYQNIKLLSLFSEHMSILTTEQTDVQLLDVVIYRQANADLKTPVNKSDIYIVIGKTILVKGGANYAERIELVRRSLPMKGESKLAGTDIDSNAAAANPMPDSLVNPVATPSKNSYGAASSITGGVKSAQGSMDAMKATLPKSNTLLRNALPEIRNVALAVRNGASAAEITKAVTSAMPQLNKLKDQAKVFNTAFRATLAPIKNVKDTLKNIKNVAAGARLAALSIPGGIIASYTSALSQVRQQYSTSALLKSTATTLTARRPEFVASGAESKKAYDDLHQASTEWEAVSEDSSNTASKSWNQQVSTLSGIETPSKFTVPPSPTPGLRAEFEAARTRGEPLPPLTALVITDKPWKSESLDQRTSAVTSEMSTMSMRYTPWAQERPAYVVPVPQPDVEAKLNVLNEELKVTTYSEQDLYKSNWQES